MMLQEARFPFLDPFEPAEERRSLVLKIPLAELAGRLTECRPACGARPNDDERGPAAGRKKKSSRVRAIELIHGFINPFLYEDLDGLGGLGEHGLDGFCFGFCEGQEDEFVRSDSWMNGADAQAKTGEVFCR